MELLFGISFFYIQQEVEVNVSAEGPRVAALSDVQIRNVNNFISSY